MERKVMRQHLARFKSLYPGYMKFIDVASALLDAEFLRCGVKLQQPESRVHFESRIKTFRSIIEKANFKGLEDPLTQLTDICGLRLVCALRSDLDEVDRIIRGTLDVIRADTKVQTTSSNVFGYLSNHYIFGLKPSQLAADLPYLRGLRGEIQVRTIVMDAWARLSHHLVYKQSTDVPEALLRDYYALSGLFWIADTHFEMFFEEAARNREAIEKRAKEEQTFLLSPLDLDTLTVFLARYYPDRVQHTPADTSHLLSELLAADYCSLKDLQRKLDQGKDFLAVYESTWPPAGSRRYTSIGAVRRTLEATDQVFANVRRVSPMQRQRFQIAIGQAEKKASS